jgi:preprotein translocase subunit SecE
MAKGKASNIADKIKWLLSISIFSAAIVGNSYYTEVAFLFLQLLFLQLLYLEKVLFP